MNNEQLPRLLALDDDEDWLEQIPLILRSDCKVDTFPSIDQGLQSIEQNSYDIILLDLNFEGDSRDGLDVFRRIHALDRGTDVIVMSGETNRERLISIFNAGVTQFLPKPATNDQIRAAVRKTIDLRTVRNRALTIATATDSHKGPTIIGKSLATLRLKAEIERVVKSGAKDIFLLGETGTGKEVVAQTIVRLSDSSSRFIPIHCGAVTDSLFESELFGHTKGSFTGAIGDKMGAFEAAGGGFVFLDEIGEMPLNQQAKLLRVLQERTVQRVGDFEPIRVNFRMIAATNVQVEKAVAEGKFREDLYYRIAKNIIKIPSLRDRIEDLPEIVNWYIASVPSHRKKKFTNGAMDLLQIYDWPGNIRQLNGIVEALCSRCTDNVIREKDVCQALPEVTKVFTSRTTKSLVGRYGTQLLTNERRKFEKAINEARGDRTEAAKILGLSRATFFRKAKDLGLVKERRAFSDFHSDKEPGATA